MNLTLIAIFCGIVAVLYGIITSRQVLATSAGNQRMIDIAAAIQEESIRAGLLRMAAEFEGLAAREE